MDRAVTARIGGMEPVAERDWVHRFNASGPEGLIDNRTEGPKSRLLREKLAQFAKVVEASPDREKDDIVRWRRVDLKRVIAERVGVDFHPRYAGKLPKKLGLSHISARLSHPAQDWRIVGEFKKTFRALKARLGGLSETPPIEIRFEDVPRRTRDEGRGRPEERARPTVGQARNKTKAGRRSALRQRLSIRRDMAARGVGAALAPPYADTDMMQLHLDETSSNLAKGAHARLLLDRAGWRIASRLDMPENTTPIFLAFAGPGAKPGRERLAVSPSELDLNYRRCRR
jgi:transposase